jgi:hypothetical protein
LDVALLRLGSPRAVLSTGGSQGFDDREGRAFSRVKQANEPAVYGKEGLLGADPMIFL